MPTVCTRAESTKTPQRATRACSRLLSYERTFCSVRARLFARQGGSPWSVSFVCRWTSSTCSSPVRAASSRTSPTRRGAILLAAAPGSRSRSRRHQARGLPPAAPTRRLPALGAVPDRVVHLRRSDDLARFFRGSIAKAFGIESEPIPPRFMPEPADEPAEADDVAPLPQRRPRARATRRGRLRPSSRPALRSASTDRTSRWGRLRVPSRRTWRRSDRRGPRACSSPGRPARARPRPSSCCPVRSTSSGTPADTSFASTAASSCTRPIFAGARSAAELHRLRRRAAARRRTAHARLHPPPRRVEKADEAVHDVFLGLLDEAGSRHRTARPSRRPERSWR